MPRTKGSERLHDRLKSKIHEYAQQEHPRLTPDQVGALLQQEFGDRGFYMPTIPTIRNEMGKQRKFTQDVDIPWSVGLSLRHGILAEAMPDLLEVQELCLKAGQSMSVRLAKWVAQLHKVVPDDTRNPKYFSLYRLAYRYSIRERACYALGIPVDTEDLDHRLMNFKGWEERIARQAGVITIDIIGERYWLDHERAGIPLPYPRPDLSLVDGYTDYDLYEGFVLNLVAKDLGIYPPIQVRPLTREADGVNGMLLRLASKGSKWHLMSQRERRSIADRLFKWVKTVEEQYKDSRSEHWWPTAIMKEVGYED